MSKRSATSDLNHDNWDEDQTPEESGEFSKAPEDVLKNRVVKKARRRNPIGSYQNDESKPNAFGGFSAFAKTTPSPAATFGFLANLTPNKGEPPKTNGMSEKTTQKENNLEEYYAKLKGLNESVAEWIKQHVSDNPLIDLQPIFKDYERYMKDLDNFKADISKKTEVQPTKILFNFAPSVTATVSPSSTSISTSTPGTSAPKFSFGTSNTTGSFAFGSSTTTAAATTAPTFSFGSSLASTASVTSISSTLSSGEPAAKFSFTSKPTTETKKENADEVAEDEPPKVEFTRVVEKDHVYTTRCKVFVKKDNSYGDRGVGTLYLKQIPDKDKFQLIVRADTNLGNLLCNFILSDGIPMQRVGKKDVMLVCLPTPESKPPPTAILLRVKSSEDADELLKTLEKYKK